MVGLDKFREAFAEYSDNYVIIGGTACEIVMAGTGIRLRATHDIDMIVIKRDNHSKNYKRQPKPIFPVDSGCSNLCSLKDYDMEIALKRNQSFRLPIDLIERLKQLAKRENRSLNNYVETLLLDAAYHEPNAETIAAMRKAESSILRNEKPLDLSSIEAMEKSMGS